MITQNRTWNKVGVTWLAAFVFVASSTGELGAQVRSSRRDAASTRHVKAGQQRGGVAVKGEEGFAAAGRHGAVVGGEEGYAAVGRHGAVVKGDEGAAAVGRRGAVVVGEEGGAAVGRRGAVVVGGRYESYDAWKAVAAVGAGIAIGTMLARPPAAATAIVVTGSTYYYYDSVYYTGVMSGGTLVYQVVGPPAGAVIVTLPPNCTSVRVGNTLYTQCGTTYYQRVSTGYRVVVVH